eukprot:scaffold416_cov329-Pavlova_lutheri.AAC.47
MWRRPPERSEEEVVQIHTRLRGRAHTPTRPMCWSSAATYRKWVPKPFPMSHPARLHTAITGGPSVTPEVTQVLAPFFFLFRRHGPLDVPCTRRRRRPLACRSVPPSDRSFYRFHRTLDPFETPSFVVRVSARTKWGVQGYPC